MTSCSGNSQQHEVHIQTAIQMDPEPLENVIETDLSFEVSGPSLEHSLGQSVPSIGKLQKLWFWIGTLQSKNHPILQFP